MIANKSISALAEEIEASRPKLYQHEALITDKEVRERRIFLLIISDLANEAFEQKAVAWLLASNPLFLCSWNVCLYFADAKARNQTLKAAVNP